MLITKFGSANKELLETKRSQTETEKKLTSSLQEVERLQNKMKEYVDEYQERRYNWILASV